LTFSKISNPIKVTIFIQPTFANGSFFCVTSDGNAMQVFFSKKDRAGLFRVWQKIPSVIYSILFWKYAIHSVYGISGRVFKRVLII